MFKDILVHGTHGGARGGLGRSAGRRGDYSQRARAMGRLIGTTRGGSVDARDRADHRILSHLARTGGNVRGLRADQRARGAQLHRTIVRDMNRRQSTAGQALRPSTSARAQAMLRRDLRGG